MEKIISFIVENWRIIADVCAAMLALVLFICRKKPVKVVDAVLTNIFEIIPDFICVAERQFPVGHGSEKLGLVIDMVCSWLEEKYPGDIYKSYIPIIKEYIEIILSTPQKKGD